MSKFLPNKIITSLNRHKAIKQSIVVGAGKFLGVRKILPEFAQTCPKYFCATFAYKIFSLPQRSWRPFFGMIFKQKVLICFSAIWNQTTLGAKFARIFRDFAQIFRDFAQMFGYFAWIFGK